MSFCRAADRRKRSQGCTVVWNLNLNVKFLHTFGTALIGAICRTKTALLGCGWWKGDNCQCHKIRQRIICVIRTAVPALNHEAFIHGNLSRPYGICLFVRQIKGLIYSMANSLCCIRILLKISPLLFSLSLCLSLSLSLSLSFSFYFNLSNFSEGVLIWDTC